MNRPNQMRMKSLYLSDTAFIKFRYQFNSQINGAGGAVSKVWRGNGPYDPVFALGGTQPNGWGFWSQAYRKYICYGSKIICKCVNTGTLPYELILMPSLTDDGDGLASVYDYIGQPYIKHVTIGGSNGGNDVKTLKQYMSTAKLFGVPKKKVTAEDNFNSAMGNVPANGWYWILGGQYVEPSTAEINLNVQLTITYYVRLYDRILLD